MTTFNTGNPIGSVDPRDLYDNAENLDTAVNTKTDTTWTDRLGVERKTFHGMEVQFDSQQVDFEDRFQETLSKIGYENIGDYAAGLEITEYNQIFRHEGEWWRAAATTELPYTTTGDWSSEEGLFVGVGDAALRQELASDDGTSKIGYEGDSLKQILDSRIMPGVVLDTASTSWAKIASDDPSDYQHDEFANLLNDKKTVIVDTEFYINDTVFANVHGQTIKGSPTGKILAGAGMAQNYMLELRGNGITVDGIIMDNPMQLKSVDGGKQTAITIRAHDGTVKNSLFTNMLHAVANLPDGEWHNTRILYNKALDCIGVGAGPNDDGTTTWGEDRGDAFTIWGATGMIVGNYAIAAPGQDARIGIHCEGLMLPGRDPEYDDSDFIVANNYVQGPFRRHIAFEAISRGIATGNISAGGATWWNISLTTCRGLVFSDSIIRYTRDVNDYSGRAWSPVRAAICVGRGSENLIISDTVITATENSQGSAITDLVGLASKDVTINNVVARMSKTNREPIFEFTSHSDIAIKDCELEGGLQGVLKISGATNSLSVKDTKIKDVSLAINTSGNMDISISGNDIETTSSDAITITSNNRAVHVTDNGFKSITGHDFVVANTGDAQLVFVGNRNKDGNGTVSMTSIPATSESYYSDNHGYSNTAGYANAVLGSISARVNTRGKYPGKQVVATDGVLYVSSGSAPSSTWRSTVSGVSDITPS